MLLGGFRIRFSHGRGRYADSAIGLVQVQIGLVVLALGGSGVVLRLAEVDQRLLIREVDVHLFIDRAILGLLSLTLTVNVAGCLSSGGALFSSTSGSLAGSV